MAGARARDGRRSVQSALSPGAASHGEDAWDQINWNRTNRNVRRLQVGIVKATKEGRWGRAQALQHLLTHSFSGKALAVRRVTENRGSKTPGVDGETWTTSGQKWKAIHQLRQHGYRPRPLRRVFIAMRESTSMRPLGIPVMRDRAMQALYLLALAPIAETTGDEGSYGFRTGHLPPTPSNGASRCSQDGTRRNGFLKATLPPALIESVTIGCSITCRWRNPSCTSG